jgi:hypothetical protein
MAMTGRSATRGALALAAVILAGGCASAGSSPAAGAFLARAHQYAPDINNYLKDSQLLALGHALCDDLSSGATAGQVADRVGSEGAGAALPSYDLGSVMEAASQTLCPRYAKLFGSGGPG